jgi:hypothetical protein
MDKKLKGVKGPFFLLSSKLFNALDLGKDDYTIGFKLGYAFY